MFHLITMFLTAIAACVVLVTIFICGLIISARRFDLERIQDAQWKSYNH